MKKLRLKALSLGAKEILNREQLKAISGGCTTSQDCGALLPVCSSGTCVASGGGNSSPTSGYASGDVPCIPGTAICGNCGCQTPGDCNNLGGCGTYGG